MAPVGSQFMASVGLVDKLCREHIHTCGTYFDLIMSLCDSPSLAALSLCNHEIHDLVVPHLARSERASAEAICAHFGCSSVEEMGAQLILSGRASLAPALCRHLGVMLREGCVLERVVLIQLFEGGMWHSLRLEELRGGRKGSLVLSGEARVLLPITIHLIGGSIELSRLSLNDSHIDDQVITSFSQAISKGAFPNLAELYLRGNSISDVGVRSFSKAVVGGALANLTLLDLGKNQIGDKGISAFSQAIADGALAKLAVRMPKATCRSEM